MRLVPIDSTKNVVQFNVQIATVAVGVILVAKGVNPSAIDETDVTKTANVEDGSMVRGFSISLRIYNESGVADSNSTVAILRKNEGGALGNPTLAMLNTLGTQDWKNRIFHIEQAITGSQVSGWPMGFPSIKIPKRFHVMRHNDAWELWIGNNTGNNLRICGTITYKWYK